MAMTTTNADTTRSTTTATEMTTTTTTTTPPDDDDDDAAEVHFVRFLTLMEEHGLHRVRLELFDDNEGGNGNNGTKNGPLRRRILLSLGERLMTEKRSEAAHAVFLSAGGPQPSGEGEGGTDGGLLSPIRPPSNRNPRSAHRNMPSHLPPILHQLVSDRRPPPTGRRKYLH